MEEKDEKYINNLIKKFEDCYPVLSELGTPIVTGTKETDMVIEFGKEAVEPLIDALKSERPRIVMYVAFCLGEIGDKTAVSPLKEIRTVYSQKSVKDTDDYAVISSIYGVLSILGAITPPVFVAEGGGWGGKKCECKPKKITLVKSGNLQGGKSMDDYYPDLKGKGYYDDPKKAGPFDTGSRVGASVQIVAEVEGDPKKCKLGQDVYVERENINGRKTTREGKTYDDLAKCGRDATSAPFKQDFDGKTSFADPPSATYGAGSNIDSKRVFTSCVIGCDNKTKCCVKWSLEIKVENGVVKKNEVKEIKNWCK